MAMRLGSSGPARLERAGVRFGSEGGVAASTLEVGFHKRGRRVPLDESSSAKLAPVARDPRAVEVKRGKG